MLQRHSSTNRDYIRWHRRNFDGIRQARHDFCRQAEKEFAQAILAEQKRRQPKNRKNYRPLDKDSFDRIKTEYLAKHKPTFDAFSELLKRAEARREQRIDELAEQVQFVPDPFACHRIKESSSGDYRSQPACTKYARESLRMLEIKLQELGFEVHVRERCELPFFQGGHWSGRSYELWANCLPELADAVKYSIREWVQCCWDHGVNPRVYNPFLPHDY